MTCDPKNEAVLAYEVPVAGSRDPAFAEVERALRENFCARNELGAAVRVLVGGRVVVDMWAGHRDAARSEIWQRDTLVNIYSLGKGIAAMFVLALVERGELALDRPLRDIWSEIAAPGKVRLTLRKLA